MPGMMQRGPNTLLNLGLLTLAGSVPQGASATLTVAHPLIKAGDIPLFSFPQLPTGLGSGAFLQEWYCTDGALNVTYRSVQEGSYAVNQTVTVALLRSPGFVKGPQPVPDMGRPIRLGTVANEGGVGPQSPLWIDTTTNNSEKTIAAGEAVVFDCNIWAAGPPPNQTPTWNAVPTQFSGPASLPDGLAITGWQQINTVAGPGSIFRLGVVNRTGAPIVVAAGAMGELRVVMAGTQLYGDSSARSFASGGRLTGPVTRRHARGATFPGSSQDLVAFPNVACEINPASASTPDGQRMPNTSAPAAGRIWVTAPRGVTGTGIGWTRLNTVSTNGRCTHRASVTGATTIAGNSITQDMQHIDYIV